MTPAQHAQAAARDAPTPRDIARVTAAMLSGPPACHYEGTINGWRVTVHDSFITPGALLVNACHPTLSGLSEEVATIEAARVWVRRVVLGRSTNLVSV